ncbi:hypothetical protein FQN54_000706 [Arachnomyces sp. PD_36]|nr:hypothetical protein FQN54_000706 [Arachnomyces sp. PD_36]
MPPWGRPPGARLGRQQGGRRRRWEESARVEELDSELDVDEDDDDDDDEGVLLDPSYEKRRLVGEKELRRLGMDMVPRNGRREGYEYEEESDYEEEDYLEGQDRTLAYAMQLAMRDKEDTLVEKALERIRRAQMLGKTNVKLSKRELEALEKKRRQSAMGSQRKKENSTRPAVESPRRNTGERVAAGTASKTKTERQRASRASISEHRPVPNYYQPPNEAFTPPTRSRASTLEYYGSPVRPSSSSSQARPRTPTTQSLRPQQLNASPRYQQQLYQNFNPPLDVRYSVQRGGAPMPYDMQYQNAPQSATYQQPPRFYPVPEGSQSRRASISSRNPPQPRALPDDPVWAPPPRSSTSLVPYTAEQSAGDDETSEDEEEEDDDDDEDDDDNEDDDDDDEDNGVQVETPVPVPARAAPAPTGVQPKAKSNVNNRQAYRQRRKRR